MNADEVCLTKVRLQDKYEKEKKMRKTFTIVSLLVALSLILTACGGGATPTQAAVTEPPAVLNPRQRLNPLRD